MEAGVVMVMPPQVMDRQFRVYPCCCCGDAAICQKKEGYHNPASKQGRKALKIKWVGHNVVCQRKATCKAMKVLRLV
jgi:hypothetical protein